MAEPSVALRGRARRWLELHYSGRGWDEQDLVALIALLAEVEAEERAAIVAWLRAVWPNREAWDLIEHGEHLQGVKRGE